MGRESYSENQSDGNLLRKRHPLLTAEEEAFLGMIIQKSPDAQQVEKAQTKFLLANVRLAVWMATTRRFEISLSSFEDVAQAGGVS